MQKRNEELIKLNITSECKLPIGYQEINSNTTLISNQYCDHSYLINVIFIYEDCYLIIQLI